MDKRTLQPITPGEILKEEFLEDCGISAVKLAESIGVPKNRIYEIIHGTREITPDTAFRLSRFFGNSPEFWINLQVRYNMRMYERTRWNTVKKRVQVFEAMAS